MDVQKIREQIVEIPEMFGVHIVVVGSGYVGLPLAVLRALQGAQVSVVDIDQEKIDLLKQGIPPFHEDGLPEFLAEAIGTGRISFHTDLSLLVPEANVIIGCVGTPPNPDGSANLGAIFAIAKQIGKNMVDGQRLLVIQTSTVPPGTSRKMYHTMTENLIASDVDLVIADRPEFLQQGYAFRDNVDYDRKVAAIYPEKVWAKDLLLGIEHTKKTAPFLIFEGDPERDLETAELVKYAANDFLATKISFINEIAEWADGVGADVTKIADSLGLDVNRIKRWGLNAGLGFGGGCFPKDTTAAIDSMASVGVNSEVIAGAVRVNSRQPERFVQKIFDHFKDLKGVTIACGGVSFKPDTDFVYPSQSLEVIKLLLEKGAKVKVYDPEGLDNLRSMEISSHENLVICDSVSEMLDRADAYALLTEWSELRNLTSSELTALSGHVIFDGRNAMDMTMLKEEGFTYYGMGR